MANSVVQNIIGRTSVVRTAMQAQQTGLRIIRGWASLLSWPEHNAPYLCYIERRKGQSRWTEVEHQAARNTWSKLRTRSTHRLRDGGTLPRERTPSDEMDIWHPSPMLVRDRWLWLGCSCNGSPTSIDEDKREWNGLRFETVFRSQTVVTRKVSWFAHFLFSIPNGIDSAGVSRTWPYIESAALTRATVGIVGKS